MRRRILYVERNIDGTIGGSYRSLLYLVRLLPKDRIAPVVAFYREHHLLPDFERAGCRVLLLHYPRRVNLIERFPQLAKTGPGRTVLLTIQKAVNFVGGSFVLFLRHVALLRRERIDVVHLNNGVMGGTELLFASRVLGVKTIAHQRGIAPLPNTVKVVARLIDHAICVSDAARINLLAHGLRPEQCTTVHNGIDPLEFRRLITRDRRTVRRELRIPDDTLVVGHAGMIRRWKGQLVIVQAMALLKRKHPNLHCLIVGGTSDRHGDDLVYMNEISLFVEEHGLGDCVQIVDYQPNIAEYIQVFDIMVHSATEAEPFSRSVLEGMTLGRAMVATRTGGTPEAIEDGVTGLLIKPNDPEDMARGVDAFLRDPVLRERLGRHAQERIAERFHIQANVRSTLRIYDRLLGARPS